MAPARVLDRDNAAPIYQQAGAASGQFSKAERLEEIWSTDWRKVDFTHEKVIEFINSSQPVLRLLRRGAAMPAARFDWDSSDPMIVLSEVQFLREGAHALLLDAMLRIHAGNSAAAAADLSAVFAIANQLDGPDLVVVLVALQLEVRAMEAPGSCVSERHGLRKNSRS